MSIHKLIRQGRERLGLTEEAFGKLFGVSRGAVQQWHLLQPPLRVVFFACTGNYLQISMIVFLALLVFLAHNSPMPQTKRHRVSGSAVTTEAP